MDEPKYCRDCKHYRPGEAVDCTAPQNMQTSLVTGEQIVTWQAQVSREMELTGCGVSGRWWEAKNGME